MENAGPSGIVSPELILVVLNLALGLGCAVPIARLVGRLRSKPKKTLRYLVALVGLYLVESVALMMGMGIPVFSVMLAFVWGIVLGRSLRVRVPAREALRLTFFISLYSSLPAGSFVIIPVLLWIGGDPILSREFATGFGIPAFFPWPLGTILGFYTACALGAVVLKTVITTGEVGVLLHLAEKPAPTDL